MITVSARQRAERELGGLLTKNGRYTRAEVMLVTAMTWFVSRSGDGRDCGDSPKGFAWADPTPP